MDWGTPRLVTKNRAVNLNAKNLDARNLLMKFANARNGEVEETGDKPKQEFNQATVSNFRKKMMEEELNETNSLKKSMSKDPVDVLEGDKFDHRRSSVANTVVNSDIMSDIRNQFQS